MRREKEILDSLNSVKSMSDEEFNEPLEGGGYNQGWIDALNFVLYDEFDRVNLPKEFIKVLEKVELEVYYENGLKHISGGYADATVIETDTIIDYESDDEDEIDVYIVDVMYGVEGSGNSSTIRLAFRKDNYKEVVYE